MLHRGELGIVRYHCELHVFAVPMMGASFGLFSCFVCVVWILLQKLECSILVLVSGRMS